LIVPIVVIPSGIKRIRHDGGINLDNLISFENNRRVIPNGIPYPHLLAGGIQYYIPVRIMVREIVKIKANPRRVYDSINFVF
jgi:hypothetical protein